MQEMITANRLSDGLVVFLDADGGWTEDFHRGAVLDGRRRQGDGARARRSGCGGQSRRRPLPH